MSSSGRSRLGRGGGRSGKTLSSPLNREASPATPSSSAARLPVVVPVRGGSRATHDSEDWANDNPIGNPLDEAFSSQPDNQQPQMTLEDLLHDPDRATKLPKLDPFPTPETTWFDRDEKSKISTCVSNIIRGGYKGVYLSWTNTPPQVRDQFFVKFAQTYYWNPAITETVRAEFIQLGIIRMKGITTQIKKEGKCPKWMNADVYEMLLRHWATEKAQEKSRKTREARSSDRDGCGPHKHVSGRKSYYRVQCELERKFDRPATISEVFLETHTDRKTKSFVDKKAEKISETYEQKKSEYIQSQKDSNPDLSDAASQTIALTPEQDNEIFLQSTLPDRRGNRYGLGNLGRKYGQGNIAGSSDSTVTDTITSLQQQMASYKEQVEQEMASLRHQNQEILKYLQTAVPSFPAHFPNMAPPAPRHDGSGSSHMSPPSDAFPYQL